MIYKMEKQNYKDKNKTTVYKIFFYIKGETRGFAQFSIGFTTKKTNSRQVDIIKFYVADIYKEDYTIMNHINLLFTDIHVDGHYNITKNRIYSSIAKLFNGSSISYRKSNKHYDNDKFKKTLLKPYPNATEFTKNSMKNLIETNINAVKQMYQKNNKIKMEDL